MKSYLVLCDCDKGACPTVSAREYDTQHSIWTQGSQANARIESIGPKFFEQLSPLLDDLVRLAAYVYFADRLSSRGDVDVFGERWCRAFHFVVPVQQPQRWSEPEVHDKLLLALEWLTGDRFEFDFVARTPCGERQEFLLDGSVLPRSTCVSLFSGGLDSLAGVVWDCVENGQRPLLVSHRPHLVINSRQRKLAELLAKRLSPWSFPHVQAWINFKGEREAEYTQRSRSFLYLALAEATACQLGIPKVRVYENGITSLNIPVSAQTVGTTLTRTTHPVFIHRVGQFFDSLLGCAPQIETPFNLVCKGEVAALLRDAGHADLIAASTSCAHTRYMTKAQPGCGVCSQCIERQFALWGTGLRRHDHHYKHDLFRSSLGEVEGPVMAKAMVEGYVRTHVRAIDLTQGELYDKSPEVADALDVMDGDPAEVFDRIYQMYQTHSMCVRKGLRDAIRLYAEDLLSGELPADCLLRLVGSGSHLTDPVETLAVKIGDLLEDAVPRAFRTREAENETQVQDAVEAALAAAGVNLKREFPILDFLQVKGTKPDFSTHANTLFVEVKYPRPTRPMSQIGDEIAADITEYGESDAAVLFVVYDPTAQISDKRAFEERLRKHPRVYGRVVRK